MYSQYLVGQLMHLTQCVQYVILLCVCVVFAIHYQSSEVGGSYHMEKEGLKRGLDHLESNGLEVDYIVTDRHPQIKKFLRERNIEQFYDVWHFEKGK